MLSTGKLISESRAIVMLGKVRDEFRSAVGVYERKATACSSCTTRGACCLDAHFVNVRISRLEAVAIRNALDALANGEREIVLRKVAAAIERHGLDAGSDRTYACPLYDRTNGCLVHDIGKPLPCIHHACYERKEDLPPDELLDDAELAVERLNLRVYGRPMPLLPLPIAIQKVLT